MARLGIFSMSNSNGNHKMTSGSASSDTSSPSRRPRQRIPYPAPKEFPSLQSITPSVGRPMNHVSNDIGGSISTTFSEESSEDHALAKHDFMVSFMVDARGGSMLGCRYNGVKVDPNRIA